MDLLNLNEYGPKKSREYRYTLVKIDNFYNFGWTVLLNKINAQTIKLSSENILDYSKKKPKLIESDDGEKSANKISTEI